MATINQYYSIGSTSGARWLDDDHIVFLTNRSGVNQIWEKCLSTGEEKQLTFFSERVGGIHVEGESIYFTMDLGGNEQHQLYVMHKGQEPKNLTNNNAVRHFYGGLKPDG